MSRGYWDYRNESLKSDIFGWDCGEEEKIPNVFEDKEISYLIYDVFKLLYAYDSYKSGDWNRGDYKDSLAEFKSKYLLNRNENLKDIIINETNNLKEELLEMIK